MLKRGIAVGFCCLLFVGFLWLVAPTATNACDGPNCAYMPIIGGSQGVPRLGVALAYNRCDLASRVGGTWVHNYGSNPPSCPGVTGVPMIWGPDEMSMPVSFPPGQPCWLLSFNEPNEGKPYGPGVSAEEYVDYQHTIEQRFPDCKIASPGPSHSDIQWLQRSRDAYITRYGTPPRWDALVMHCYLYSWECQEMSRQYLQWAQDWNIPEIWITEYATLPCRYRNLQAALQDADVFIRWAGAQPRITRLAWFAELIYGSEPWSFGTCSASLFDPSFQFTSFGALYQSLAK